MPFLQSRLPGFSAQQARLPLPSSLCALHFSDFLHFLSYFFTVVAAVSCCSSSYHTSIQTLLLWSSYTPETPTSFCPPLNGCFWIDNLRNVLSTPTSLSWNASLSFHLLLAITLKQQARPIHTCSAGTWPRGGSPCHVPSRAGNSFWLPVSVHRTAICSGCNTGFSWE